VRLGLVRLSLARLGFGTARSGAARSGAATTVDHAPTTTAGHWRHGCPSTPAWALLGGRLLPPGLLAEPLPTVTVPPGSTPLPLYDRYGLGLLETETPAGRLGRL
jgi:hypothetical protein